MHQPESAEGACKWVPLRGRREERTVLECDETRREREQTEARNIAPLVRQTKRTAPDAGRERADITSVRRITVALKRVAFRALIVKRA
jgi:hypothetical protein